MVLAFAHFIILYSLELRVKYYTLKMEAEGNVPGFGNKRTLLFLIILSLTLFPLFWSVYRFSGTAEPWQLFALPLNVSSALFALYFCICKLYDRSHTDRFYAITVPAGAPLTKRLAVAGIIIILSVVFHSAILLMK